MKTLEERLESPRGFGKPILSEVKASAGRSDCRHVRRCQRRALIRRVSRVQLLPETSGSELCV